MIWAEWKITAVNASAKPQYNAALMLHSALFILGARMGKRHLISTTHICSTPGTKIQSVF